jgi:hypothetical protein
MAGRVNERTANWRIFGGGGLVLGGLLWLIVTLVAIGGALDTWLRIIAFIALAVAGFMLAFGQTGSNGIVGGSVLGKLGFVAFGIGFALLALVPLLGVAGVALPAGLATVGIVLIAIGGVIGAIVTYQKGVARGVARWIFFVPAVIAVVWMLTTLGLVALASNVLTILLALAYALAGVAFLLNRR